MHILSEANHFFPHLPYMVVTNLRGMKHQGKLLVIEYSKKSKRTP